VYAATGLTIGRVSNPADVPILILTGPPGVGKTTTAEILAARWPQAVHLESDAFFRFVSSGYVEPWKPESHDQNRVVMSIVAEAAAGYAAADYCTIVDGIVIPGWFLEPLRDRLHDAGYPVACAVLRAPLPVCIARVQSREGDPPVDSGALSQIWESFADLGDFEQNALDVDGRSPSEAADLVERRLADGRLRI
jgi:predicted kinase